MARPAPVAEPVTRATLRGLVMGWLPGGRATDTLSRGAAVGKKPRRRRRSDVRAVPRPVHLELQRLARLRRPAVAAPLHLLAQPPDLHEQGRQRRLVHLYLVEQPGVLLLDLLDLRLHVIDVTVAD